ncbi:unnamed protein product [Soboliphyme baturini]|uniref:hydroxyacylglutathione hydrolase n=1 Tax=Soboliphyme baturini TaxID=241478 RepID=A0A183IBX1_9BILA|nr:unnamed protein product [Soboliphyme baturini]
MLHVVPIPALSDNYMYLLIDKKTNDAALVDPVEANKAITKSKENNATVRCVLTTHHHWDHSGGNEEVHNILPEATIYSGAEHASYPFEQVSDGKIIKIGSLQVKCLMTPCHTKDHVCYYVEDSDGQKAVFTGDTLFIAGCGKFFEGTGEEMYNSLVKKLGALPDDTKVYCGHEYTASNLKFAMHVEPSNAEIAKKLQWAQVCCSKWLYNVYLFLSENGG